MLPLLLSLLCGVVIPAPAAELRPASSIEVTAEAEVEAAPDVAVLEFAVRTEAETAAAAARENAARMEATLTALRKALGAKAELQTGSYTLRPSYAQRRDGGTARVVGYVATNTVRLRTNELARLGELIDTAIRGGANQVQRVSFTLRDQGALRREALQKATEAARAKADALAAALGLTVSGFYSLVEHDVGDVRPVMRDAMIAAEGVTHTPVEPGVIHVRGRVSLTVLVAR